MAKKLVEPKSNKIAEEIQRLRFSPSEEQFVARFAALEALFFKNNFTSFIPVWYRDIVSQPKMLAWVENYIPTHPNIKALHFRALAENNKVPNYTVESVESDSTVSANEQAAAEKVSEIKKDSILKLLSKEPEPSKPTLPSAPSVVKKVDAKNLETLLTNLDRDFVGQEEAKQKIKEICEFVTGSRERAKIGLETPKPSLHMIFSGPPGTGKTTFARAAGKILKELGELSSGELVEVDSSHLKAEFEGQTGIKTRKLLESARGKVLIIDEAHVLGDGSVYANEAISVLVKMMEDMRDDLVIILTGYDDEMTKFLNSNPGLASRFPQRIAFHDFTAEQLLGAFQVMTTRFNYSLQGGVEKVILDDFEDAISRGGKNFGNARYVRNYYDGIIKRHTSRVGKLSKASKSIWQTITISDVTEEHQNDESIEDVYKDIDRLKGMPKAKLELRRILSLVQVNEQKRKLGMKVPPISLHTVFSGPSGSGKTTFARLFARGLKALGVLSKGNLLEVDKTAFIAEFEGQSEIKTQRFLDFAIGDVIFIDEAYGLANSKYGQLAIEVLLKKMDLYVGKIAIIIAGYDKEMEVFLDSNPGLNSRFGRRVGFDNFTSVELLDILNSMADDYQLKFAPEAIESTSKIIEGKVAEKSPNFGNARFVRNLLDSIIENQSLRLAGLRNVTPAMLSQILSEDVPS